MFKARVEYRSMQPLDGFGGYFRQALVDSCVWMGPADHTGVESHDKTDCENNMLNGLDL